VIADLNESRIEKLPFINSYHFGTTIQLFEDFSRRANHLRFDTHVAVGG
jgi:hypothetical protein